MANPNIIVIGASAGGVEPLKSIARNLPANLGAAVLVVLHVWPNGKSVLPEILNNAGPLPAFHPIDREPLEHGRICVAPPDRHLLVEHGLLRVVYGPKENRHRPAVDPLFRSAALAYRNRVIGVLLSGSLDDGTIGLMKIKEHGGIAIVQDPTEATHPGMPKSAIENVKVDYILPAAEIPAILARLTRAAGEPRQPRPKLPGTPTSIECPECHGVLQEIRDGHLVHFRCRLGHAYPSEGLAEDLEDSLQQGALDRVLNAGELHSSRSDFRRRG